MHSFRHRILMLLTLVMGSTLVEAADPVLRNWGMGAFRGMDTTVTVQSLLATDADLPATSSLVYTITAAPTKGTLRLNNVDLSWRARLLRRISTRVCCRIAMLLERTTRWMWLRLR